MGLKDGHKSEYSVWEVGTEQDQHGCLYASGDWSPLMPNQKRGYRRVYIEPLLSDSEAEADLHEQEEHHMRRPYGRDIEAPSPLDDESASILSSMMSSKGLRDMVLGSGGHGVYTYGKAIRHRLGTNSSYSRTPSMRSAAPALAPPKYDHISSLKITYNAFNDPESGKEGIPLQLLPEILESSRFVVPVEEALLEIIYKLNQRFDPGEPIKWDLLLHIAMHLERRDANKYTYATKNGPPFAWRSLQKCSLRRQDLDDFCPGIEPQTLATMKELDRHRKKCEKEGNYIEARTTARKLNELKLHESNKRRGAMLGRHIQERQTAERAYKAEIEEVSKNWDDKIARYQKEVMEHAAKLKRTHASVLENFRTKMASKKPCKPQWSAELLNQRKVQEYLGKQGKYSEALKVKKSADRLEQDELEATIESYRAEVGLKEQAMRIKQQGEMEVVLQKATKGRDQLREGRAKDLQRIQQRHKNIVRELKALHAHENFKFDQLYGKRISEYQSNLGRRSPPAARGCSSLARVAEVQVDAHNDTEFAASMKLQ